MFSLTIRQFSDFLSRRLSVFRPFLWWSLQETNLAGGQSVSVKYTHSICIVSFALIRVLRNLSRSINLVIVVVVVVVIIVVVSYERQDRGKWSMQWIGGSSATSADIQCKAY